MVNESCSRCSPSPATTKRHTVPSYTKYNNTRYSLEKYKICKNCRREDEEEKKLQVHSHIGRDIGNSILYFQGSWMYYDTMVNSPREFFDKLL